MPSHLISKQPPKTKNSEPQAYQLQRSTDGTLLETHETFLAPYKKCQNSKIYGKHKLKPPPQNALTTQHSNSSKSTCTHNTIPKNINQKQINPHTKAITYSQPTSSLLVHAPADKQRQHTHNHQSLHHISITTININIQQQTTKKRTLRNLPHPHPQVRNHGKGLQLGTTKTHGTSLIPHTTSPHL